MIQFQSVSPIGETDPLNLPVAEIDRAIQFYSAKMGFTVKAVAPVGATVERDEVTLGFAVNGNDPEQASCYIAVNNVDALQAEYKSKGVNVAEVSEMEYESKRYRVLWVKDPDGICYCIGTPVD